MRVFALTSPPILLIVATRVVVCVFTQKAISRKYRFILIMNLRPFCFILELSTF